MSGRANKQDLHGDPGGSVLAEVWKAKCRGDDILQ